MENQFGVDNDAYYRNQSEKFNKCKASPDTNYQSTSNFVLTMAEGYDCRKISRVLKSLRISGSSATVVIFRSTRDCYNVIKTCGRVVYADIIGFPLVNLEVRRYILALQWITQQMMRPSQQIKACSQFLILDFNDILFQSDPFNFLQMTGAEVVLTEEAYPNVNGKPVTRTTISNEPTGANWRWTTLRLKVLPAVVSFAVHCSAYTPKLQFQSREFHLLQNPFVNVFGEPYAIVHQINRQHMDKLMTQFLVKFDGDGKLGCTPAGNISWRRLAH